MLFGSGFAILVALNSGDNPFDRCIPDSNKNRNAENEIDKCCDHSRCLRCDGFGFVYVAQSVSILEVHSKIS